MTLLVLGADGQVGSALRWQALSRGISIVGLNRQGLDVTSGYSVIETVESIRPDVVINCAAYTDVDGAEEDVEAAHRINADAPGHIARACARTGAALIHISTDYVFDGTKKTAWTESDPVSPVGVYACTKETGERAVREAWGKHIILRTAWVFGPMGGNFVKTMLRLADQGVEKLKVVDDQRGGPTPAEAIADACLDMAGRIAGSDIVPWGTYHFCGAPTITWHGFASAILAGRGLDIQPCTTAEYPLPAPRPANSVLDCRRIRTAFGIEQPDWRDYLPDMIRDFSTSVEQDA